MPTSDKTLAVAKYFIHKNNKDGLGLTNKKLQKLLYYSQAWSLVLNNKELFKDEIEAWVHGPAIPRIYQHYKSFSYNDIKEDVNIKDLDVLSEEEKTLLDSIWKIYGKYDGNYLELLSHSEEPWQVARKGLENYEISRSLISKNIMKIYYRNKLEQTEKS